MGIAVGERDIPGDSLAELSVMAEFLFFPGKEDVHGSPFVARQHSEQRGVVLDGVGADDGEALHDVSTVSIDSTNFSVMFRAE